MNSGDGNTGDFHDGPNNNDPFDIVSTKSASVDRLKRWRQAALVLNASRRFRYTLDLKKEEEKKQTIAKIRAHIQAIRAAYRFQVAGQKPDETNQLPQSHKSADICKDSWLISRELAVGKWSMDLEQTTTTFFGDQRYLCPLRVSKKKGPPEELHQSNSSQSGIIDEKIRAPLKLLAFRKEHVLVQFWSPRLVGKSWELTTVDRPYGLGTSDNGLFRYRQHSENHPILLDEDKQEKDFGPPARVFRQGLPEWTCDLTNYSRGDFPAQDFAIRCNLRGYLALPVFDSTGCVGVLEFLTSSGYTSMAYEVQEIHKALKTENLTTPQASNCPASNVLNEHLQSKLSEIRSILKDVCDIHELPLAQTWVVTPFSSFVPFDKVLEKSCSSFDTRCIGKVCMSSTHLPFYVPDKCMWPYMKASQEQHLEKSLGVVGKAFSSRGSCFCKDLTKLSEEEYPLVHNARMYKISGCLAIFLHSLEGNDDYVLEFVLPLDLIDGGYVSLTKTLKQKFEVTSRFKLGDTSSIQEVRPSTDLSVYNKHDIIQTSSNCMTENSLFHSDSSNSIFHSDSSTSESSTTDTATTDSAKFPDQWSATNRSVVNIDAQEKSNTLKQGIKRKIESDPLPSAISIRAFKVTFKTDTQKFQFDTSLGLSILKSEVDQRFKLNGMDFALKYKDEDDDLILVAIDDDLEYAFATLGSNMSRTFICTIH
uniref:protein NLP6-like n=1 Tax=Erigeron canadensis TaxID=72917 RepID=UPI001CB8FEB4|nr:protein NLP6-like [Erigeron canadensis]